MNRQQIAKLTDRQLATLRGAVEDEIARRQAADVERRRKVAAQTVVAERYALEPVRCGKESCKCARGKPHGPYWYGYQTMGDGRVRKRYIGKRPPAGVTTRGGRSTR